eukprot:scaffold196798_cov37-Tisochrysis_lutea.AAC.4
MSTSNGLHEWPISTRFRRAACPIGLLPTPQVQRYGRGTVSAVLPSVAPAAGLSPSSLPSDPMANADK